MGDADDSYDFLEVPRFVAELRKGCDLVQGCRLPKGGGTVLPGRCRGLHRWLGNPMLSWLARRMFKTPCRTSTAGCEGSRASHSTGLELQCTGMEFATEMIIKASLFRPAYTTDPHHAVAGWAATRRPHLRTFRDGWRTLRFFLIFSPRWMFWYSGWLLMLLGASAIPSRCLASRLAGATFDVHTLVVASMAAAARITVGGIRGPDNDLRHQAGIPAIEPARRSFLQALHTGTRRDGGPGGDGTRASRHSGGDVAWYRAGFGPLDYATTMRVVIPGATMVTLGAAVILNSFLCSMLGLDRR